MPFRFINIDLHRSDLNMPSRSKVTLLNMKIMLLDSPSWIQLTTSLICVPETLRETVYKNMDLK